MNEQKIPIPARLYNAAVGGHVCGPDDIDFGQKVVHLVKYDKSGNEVSFESQVTQANKIYVIHDDFVLTADVTIPANCVLEFDGGSLSGSYTINNINNCKFIGTEWLDNSLTISNNSYFKLSWLKGDDYSAYINKYNSGTIFDLDINIQISSAISLTGLSNVSIVSSHKSIQRITNYFNMITISNSTDVTLKGFVVDGNRGSKTLDDGSTYRFAGIYLDNCNNVVIDELEVNNTLNNENNQSVIWITNTNFVSITNSIFKGTQGSILFFIYSSHAIVDGCKALLQQGSFVTGSVKFGLFTNNDIIGTPSDSINHSAISVSDDESVVENNIIQNIKGAGINIAHTGMIYNILVSGNVIKNCYLGGIYIASATSVTIINNVINNINTENLDERYFAGIRSLVGNDIKIINNDIKATHHAIYFEEGTGGTNTEGKLVFIEKNTIKTTNEIGLLYKIPTNPVKIKENIFNGSLNYCSNTWAYAKYIGNIFRGENSAIAQTTRRAMIENNVFENTGDNISLNINATYVSRNNEGNIVNITDNPAIDNDWIWATNS